MRARSSAIKVSNKSWLLAAQVPGLPYTKAKPLPARRRSSLLFRERVGSTGRRVRKIMVMALARKPLIVLWRFVIDGVLPEGAVLKPAA